jgi:superfamily II DNA or RNA helicase
MRIDLGTQKSKIFTDSPELITSLIRLYSFQVPGYQYAISYRRKHWDGSKQFVRQNGVFRTGLLSRILKDLQTIGCTPEIVDNSKTIEPKDYLLKGFTYYDYQEDFIESIILKKRGVVKAPTGSGKTLIMAGAIKALSGEGRKMVLLFNAKQLLTQTYAFLTDTCKFDNIGLCFGDGYIYGDIMLCTVQSIDRIMDTHLEETEVLMVDECHEFCNGKITLPAIEAFPNADYRIGFTATPPSDDIGKHSLEGALGPVWDFVSTSDLVDDGTLTKPVINVIDRSYTASGLDDNMTYQEVYEEYIVNNVSRNQTIINITNKILEDNDKPRILILTKSLAHGDYLLEKLGDKCQYIEGANELGDRYKAIDWFINSDKGTVLIGTKILQTGINIQEVTHLINARGMKSEIATLQALGRALRKHESKSVAYIYDFRDSEKYLRDHSRARISYYKKEGHEVILL